MVFALKKVKSKQDIDIAELYNKDEHVAGEDLPPEQEHCVKVVSTFLHAGVPISKNNLFWDLLEENGLRLAGCRTMSGMICSQKRIKEDIQGQQVSVIFDGASWLGEAMVIVLRFVDKDWNIQ